MCLEFEWFDARQALADELEDKGYVHFNGWLEDHSINIQLLFDNELLKHDELINTARLKRYSLMLKGRRYLKHFKSYDLFMIKPNMRDLLRKCLENNNGKAT